MAIAEDYDIQTDSIPKKWLILSFAWDVWVAGIAQMHDRNKTWLYYHVKLCEQQNI